MLDLRAHFSHFLGADPQRLHFAAHSHHPWPDVTRAAQLAAWDDAARLMDEKWAHVLGPVLAEARSHIARRLNLPDPASIAIAPNTHDLMRRIFSCLPAGRPWRVLTSDGEFHSFARQIARLEEDGLVAVRRIPQQPYASFVKRFAAAASEGWDLLWLSQVFFDSGFAVAALDEIAAAAGEAFFVIDGYHGFMARPTDLGKLAGRAFYMAGGYKYAMAGEGICFLHCPPGWGPRPRDTGWYAAFGALASRQAGVPYPADGGRFLGATFDPSGLYRFNAAMGWLDTVGVTVAEIHGHVLSLQALFAEGLAGTALLPERLVVPLEETSRGNFLTFDLGDAARVHERLAALGVICDRRGTRLRIGFGLYHTPEDVAQLLDRLRKV